MPTAATRKVTRRPAKTAERRPPRVNFRSLLIQFLTNKAVAEQALAVNEGEKNKKNGLKHRLLAYVMEHGEVDPDTGSRFIELAEPIDIDINGNRYKRIKAEKRQPQKVLDVDRTRELLEKKGLLDRVEEFRYTLRLDAETAEMFGEWLKETGLIERVESTNSVIIEDNLLALFHEKRKVRGEKEPQRLLSEEELDSLYDTPDPTWAFIPLTS